MRFRAKFALLDWAWLAIAAFAAFLFFSGPRRTSQTLHYYALMMIVFAATRVLLHLLIFWGITSAGFRERRLWSTRTILWQEITAIAPWPENHPNRDYVAIEFARPAPLSIRGTLIASPGDRDSFLSALRHYACNARFEINLRDSPVSV